MYNVLLPPGDNSIAINKYIISNKHYSVFKHFIPVNFQLPDVVSFSPVHVEHMLSMRDKY
jgi:hypothetical protein